MYRAISWLWPMGSRGDHGMNERFRPLTCLFALATLIAFSSDAVAAARHKQTHHAKKSDAGRKHQAAHKKGKHAAASRGSKSAKSTDTSAPAAAAPPLTGDLAAVRQAIDLVRKSKTGEATAIGKTIGDPAAQRLVEWFILRHPDGEAKFDRFAAFIADNPHWPSTALFRRRAEVRLWKERSDAATIRRFIAGQPASAKGKFALARVLLAEGDRDGAARLVREAWQSDELSERSEADALEAFRDLLTREDHRARMDKRIGAKDLAGAARAARRLGSEEIAIVKTCAAGTADKALDKLNGVSSE